MHSFQPPSGRRVKSFHTGRTATHSHRQLFPGSLSQGSLRVFGHFDVPETMTLMTTLSQSWSMDPMGQEELRPLTAPAERVCVSRPREEPQEDPRLVTSVTYLESGAFGTSPRSFRKGRLLCPSLLPPRSRHRTQGLLGEQRQCVPTWGRLLCPNVSKGHPL